MSAASPATEIAHPPRVWNLPNALTATRLGLAIVLFALISAESWTLALAVFIVAAFTDWLDGFLARRQGLTSAFGRNFDPLVDKVLICGAFIFLLAVPGAGLAAWMVTLVVARELIITGLRSFFESQAANFGADWLGKLKMVLQCAALVAVFAYLAIAGGNDIALSDLARTIRDGLIWAMLAATAFSGIQYLWRAAILLRAI
jgi:CDP-diacylglycerol---glycerol-3-phosphate 3-phosphatidyltransferase